MYAPVGNTGMCDQVGLDHFQCRSELRSLRIGAVEQWPM